jgi:hypothetical protein
VVAHRPAEEQRARRVDRQLDVAVLADAAGGDDDRST